MLVCLFSHTCLVLGPTSIFSHTSFTNTMCRSSFRVCIGPLGLQLSRNTTLLFYSSQYSNESSQIRRFDKFERILRSFKLLLVNQQAPCTPSGCLWVLFTQIILAHIKFPREIISLACAIFLHKLRDHSTALCANFIVTQTRSPYQS